MTSSSVSSSEKLKAHDDDIMSEENRIGATVYGPSMLRIYGIWVLWISNSYAWRCSTRKILLPFFKANYSDNHLDVGVGTGFYTKHLLDEKRKWSATGSETPHEKRSLTLVDLNKNSLLTAANQIDRRSASLNCVQADALSPLPLKTEQGMPQKFDSISLFFLLHCLPRMPEKLGIFPVLKRHLNDDGVLYGSTILGGGVKQNWFARILMYLYNNNGIFDNHNDTREGFVDALSESFNRVETLVVGCVLLFRATKPKQAD